MDPTSRASRPHFSRQGSRTPPSVSDRGLPSRSESVPRATTRVTRSAAPAACPERSSRISGVWPLGVTDGR